MWKYRHTDSLCSRDELTHYGISGQKWGIRRFQYDNGSYTPEGKERYGRGQANYSFKEGATRGFNKELSFFSDQHHKENEKIVEETKAAANKVFGRGGLHVNGKYNQAYDEYKSKESSLIKKYQDLYKKDERINAIEKEKDRVAKELDITERKTRLTSLELLFKREEANKKREDAIDPILETYRKLNNERQLECSRIAKEAFKDLPKDQYLVAMALFGIYGGSDSPYNTVWKKDKISSSLRGKSYRM